MAYKILPGFEKYVVFENGRIWSRSKHHFMNPSITNDGYFQTMFNRKSMKIHSLIAKAFVENPYGYKEVNHIDGDKLNCHYKNLEYCTRGHNIKHAYKLKLRNSDGARKASSKLNEWKVKAIRTLYKYYPYTQTQLGECFNVTQAQIGSIVNYRSWNHI